MTYCAALSYVARHELQKLTVVGVCFDAEAVLQTADPGTLVARSRHGAVAHSVAALDARRPLAVIQPPTVRLPSEPVASTVCPFSGVRVTCRAQKSCFLLNVL